MNIEFLALVPLALLLSVFAGVLPLPMGFERGKIKWQTWCSTGAHWHTTYWWGSERGFQSMHPADAETEEQ